ncbi:MAG: ABC transporter ATP-binding protein [Streptosporangiales bacterium]|nr:ABC transporter ATP-binding protein [Streptosporangiales bacterium]MBO0891019.1 ABC transporter ATP-binding protein [Acidothermales bacterium]
MTELTVRDVVTGYSRVEILHGVTLSATGGEVTCVFGPNGCGKSTLLKAIAGVVGVWSGSVRLDDADVTGLPSHRILRHGLALMPQGGGVFPQLTVRENLRIGAYSVPSRDDRRERIDAVLEDYPRLRERLSVQAGNLSGGEQMMLAIARALVVRPRVVLFDEPSAGLSPRLAGEALGRAAALAERGVAVLMVEQNLREAMRVADRVHILAAGENRFSGTPTDIESDRQLMELYLGAAT